MRTNKSNLNSIIEWSSSRYNEYKKSDVIKDVIFRVEKGEDCQIDYTSGVYSEGAHTGQYSSKWSGGSYKLEIINGKATLTNNYGDEQVELEKPKTNTYYIPADRIFHKIDKYGIPIGYFDVINQDIGSFHVIHDGKLRHIEKKDCEVVQDMKDKMAENEYVGFENEREYYNSKKEVLNDIKQKYGENSYEYEYLKNELELSMEQYVDLVSSISGELKKQGLNNTDMIAQDYLNEYIENVDIHPLPDDLDKIVGFVNAEYSKHDENSVISGKTEQEYELGFGYLGNGITIWNRLEERGGDYRTIAHIQPDRSVSFYDKDMPESIKEFINNYANTANPRRSETDPYPVLYEKEAAISKTEMRERVGYGVPYFSIDSRTLESAEVEAGSLEQFADSKKHFAEITANDFVANEARNEARCLAEKALSIREAISEARENGSIPLKQAKTIWEAAGKTDNENIQKERKYIEIKRKEKEQESLKKPSILSDEYHYMSVSLSDVEKIKPHIIGHVADVDNPAKAIIKMKKSELPKIRAILSKGNSIVR